MLSLHEGLQPRSDSMTKNARTFLIGFSEPARGGLHMFYVFHKCQYLKYESFAIALCEIFDKNNLGEGVWWHAPAEIVLILRIEET
jgi:hypothetical protein